MRLPETSIRTKARASALVLAMLPTIASANIVVVRSTGPSARTYPAGQSVAETGQISLRTGDRVVLLGPGGTRTLSGPGTFPAAPGTVSAASRQQMARRYAAAMARANQQSALGGNRRVLHVPADVVAEMANLPDAPGLWTYALGTRGNFCVPDVRDFILARPAGAPAASITMVRIISPGVRHQMPIAAGTNILRWNGFTPVDGDNLLVLGASTLPYRLRIVQIGTPPEDPQALTALLATRGCTEQLDRLSAALPPES
jgi:hypothetical protein